MPSFSCDTCQGVFKKKKAEEHRCSGWNTTFSCIDCNRNFDLTSIKAHSSCITEAEKVQGSLYKGKCLKNNDTVQSANAEATAELGQKRDRSQGANESKMQPEQAEEKGTKKSKSSAALAPEWEDDEVSKAIMALVEKKSLMMSKLRKKLKKQLGRSVEDAEFVQGLLKLGSYVTLSKTVVSMEDDD